MQQSEKKPAPLNLLQNLLQLQLARFRAQRYYVVVIDNQWKFQRITYPLRLLIAS
jgi:hypothetical protein